MKMVTSEEGQGLKNGKKGSTPGSPQLLQPNGQGAESSEDEREGMYWSQVRVVENCCGNPALLQVFPIKVNPPN